MGQLIQLVDSRAKRVSQREGEMHFHPFICLEELPDGIMAKTYYGLTVDGVTGEEYQGNISLSPRIFKSMRRVIKVLEHEYLHWTLHRIGEGDVSKALDSIHEHPGWRGTTV